MVSFLLSSDRKVITRFVGRVPKESVVTSQHSQRPLKELRKLTQTRRFLLSVFVTPTEDTGINGVDPSRSCWWSLGQPWQYTSQRDGSLPQ